MIQSKKDLKEYLRKDKTALGIPEKRRYPRPFYDDIWRFQRALRKSEYANNCLTTLFWIPVRLWYKLSLHRQAVKLGFDIPINAFGPGLSIASGNDAAPIIGDNVFIGSGAKIIGNVTIADRVCIGAGAVVVKTCSESGITLAGNPAKKISNNSSEKYIIISEE